MVVRSYSCEVEATPIRMDSCEVLRKWRVAATSVNSPLVHCLLLPAAARPGARVPGERAWPGRGRRRAGQRTFSFSPPLNAPLSRHSESDSSSESNTLQASDGGRRDRGGHPQRQQAAAVPAVAFPGSWSCSHVLAPWPAGAGWRGRPASPVQE